MKDNKSEIIPIRVTIAQKQELRAKASYYEYKSLGEYIRHKLGLKNDNDKR